MRYWEGEEKKGFVRWESVVREIEGGGRVEGSVGGGWLWEEKDWRGRKKGNGCG